MVAEGAGEAEARRGAALHDDDVGVRVGSSLGLPVVVENRHFASPGVAGADAARLEAADAAAVPRPVVEADEDAAAPLRQQLLRRDGIRRRALQPRPLPRAPLVQLAASAASAAAADSVHVLLVVLIIAVLISV